MSTSWTTNIVHLQHDVENEVNTELGDSISLQSIEHKDQSLIDPLLRRCHSLHAQLDVNQLRADSKQHYGSSDLCTMPVTTRRGLKGARSACDSDFSKATADRDHFLLSSSPIGSANSLPHSVSETPEYTFEPSGQTLKSTSSLDGRYERLSSYLEELVNDLRFCSDMDCGRASSPEYFGSDYGSDELERLSSSSELRQPGSFRGIVQHGGPNSSGNTDRSSSYTFSTSSGGASGSGKAMADPMKRSREEDEEGDGDNRPEKTHKLLWDASSQSGEARQEVIPCAEDDCPGQNRTVSDWL